MVSCRNALRGCAPDRLAEKEMKHVGCPYYRAMSAPEYADLAHEIARPSVGLAHGNDGERKTCYSAMITARIYLSLYGSYSTRHQSSDERRRTHLKLVHKRLRICILSFNTLTTSELLTKLLDLHPSSHR